MEAMWLIGAGLLALLCLWGSYRADRRARLIADLPVVPAARVFIGLVEVVGDAEADPPTKSYLAEVDCVWHRWTIDEHWSRTVTETTRDAKGNVQTRTRRESGTTTVASGGSQEPFFVRDESGDIRVDPRGADVRADCVLDRRCGRSDPLYYGKGPAHAVAHSDHRRTFREHAIAVGRRVYVVGQARVRSDAPRAEIAHDRAAEMFIVSTRGEDSVRRWFVVQRVTTGIIGLIVVLVGFGGWSEAYPKDAPGGYLTVAGIYGLAWGGVWLWGLVNSLINLNQRCASAVANVDVEFKRRFELIPNLVECVQAMAAHERDVQERMGALRAAAAVSGLRMESCGLIVGGLKESYPQLQSSDLFSRLQRQLEDTESRIAAALGYYAEVARAYNTRLGVWPDGAVAGAMGLKVRPLPDVSGLPRSAYASGVAATAAVPFTSTPSSSSPASPPASGGESSR